MASIPAAGLASAEVRLGDLASSTDEENFPPCVSFKGQFWVVAIALVL